MRRGARAGVVRPYQAEAGAVAPYAEGGSPGAPTPNVAHESGAIVTIVFRPSSGQFR